MKIKLLILSIILVLPLTLSFAQGKLYYGGGILPSCNGISFEQNWELTLYPNHTFVYKIRKRSFGGDMLQSRIESIKGIWTQKQKDLILTAQEYIGFKNPKKQSCKQVIHYVFNNGLLYSQQNCVDFIEGVNAYLEALSPSPKHLSNFVALK